MSSGFRFCAGLLLSPVLFVSSLPFLQGADTASWVGRLIEKPYKFYNYGKKIRAPGVVVSTGILKNEGSFSNNANNVEYELSCGVADDAKFFPLAKNPITSVGLFDPSTHDSLVLQKVGDQLMVILGNNFLLKKQQWKEAGNKEQNPRDIGNTVFVAIVGPSGTMSGTCLDYPKEGDKISNCRPTELYIEKPQVEKMMAIVHVACRYLEEGLPYALPQENSERRNALSKAENMHKNNLKRFSEVEKQLLDVRKKEQRDLERRSKPQPNKLAERAHP